MQEVEANIWGKFSLDAYTIYLRSKACFESIASSTNCIGEKPKDLDTIPQKLMG